MRRYEYRHEILMRGQHFHPTIYHRHSLFNQLNSRVFASFKCRIILNFFLVMPLNSNGVHLFHTVEATVYQATLV